MQQLKKNLTPTLIKQIQSTNIQLPLTNSQKLLIDTIQINNYMFNFNVQIMTQVLSFVSKFLTRCNNQKPGSNKDG